jgi:pimeloyl-ACP methyl ester carboxylesterase
VTPDAVPPAGPPPAVRFARVAGRRLAYRTWGAPDEDGGPPLILVHGRGADGLDWAPVARAFAATRHVVAPDLSGHGLSDRRGTYSMPGFRDDLLGLLDALGVARADLVAHSMGAFAALLLAQHEPERVARLVLEEGPLLEPLDPPRPPARRPPEPLRFDWSVIPAVDAALNAPDPAWREDLGRITAPTLVVAGGPESPFDQQQFAGLAERIPGARLVTVAAGHEVHATRPGQFLTALAEFGLRAPCRHGLSGSPPPR